jgi:cytochrome bd-type quinol oxidase subunit 2
MLNTVAPVWDGNETFLVLGGAGLYGAFPLAYSTLLPANYMPLILMVVGLIFRGAAFELSMPGIWHSSVAPHLPPFARASYLALCSRGQRS